MSARFFLTGCVVASFWVTAAAPAQQTRLKTRGEQDEERIDREYEERRANGIFALNEQAIKEMTALQQKFTKAGDLDSAQMLQARIEEATKENAFIQRTATLRSGEAPKEVIVQALIDGSTELRITAEGIYWAILGGVAKPGRHQGADEPTYVNGSAWRPRYEENRQDRGTDTSAVYRMPLFPEMMKFELLAVGPEKDSNGVERRSPISERRSDKDYVLTIPDNDGGSRWYKIRLYYPDEN